MGTFPSAISTQAKIMKQGRSKGAGEERESETETDTERRETKIQRQAETERRNQPLVADSLLSPIVKTLILRQYSRGLISF